MKKINFIAELCQNHLGKTKNVEKMLAQCALHGATTVKLQYIYAKNLSLNKYSWKQISKKTVELYKEVLQR